MNPLLSLARVLCASIRVRLAWATLVLFALPLLADQPLERHSALPEPQFRERLRALERLPGTQQSLEANTLLRERWLSSQQVKAVARIIAQEDARLDFALAAYPRTVDPENFYEVYDAFTSYSKVFRLHDHIQRLRSPASPLLARPIPPPLQPVTDETLAEMLKSLRAEGMEDGKKALARQILSGRPRFLSRQIRDLLKVFTFDDARLEIAKYAYDSVLDPENFYLVNQAFVFSDRKENLNRYVESKRSEHPNRPSR